MGLVKGNRVREDVRTMYEYLYAELEKEWSANPDVQPSKKRPKKQAASDGAAPKHLGGQYGLVAVLGDAVPVPSGMLEPGHPVPIRSPDQWHEAREFEKEQGLWGKVAVRESAFVGNAGAGPSSASLASGECKCIVTVSDGELLRSNRCNLLVRSSGCKFGSDCAYSHNKDKIAPAKRQGGRRAAAARGEEEEYDTCDLDDPNYDT